MNGIGWERPYVPTYDGYWRPDAVRPTIYPPDYSIASWPVSASGMDEESGGTFYTAWCSISNGPRMNGHIAIPNFTASTWPSGSVECWMEVGSGGSTIISGIWIGKVTSTVTDPMTGTVSRSASPDVLWAPTDGRVLQQVRWKVTGSAHLIWNLAGGSIRKLW